MSEDHEGCVLAIVGSRDVPRYQAESLIKQSLLEHKPSMVISGGARGIDSFAVEIAHEMGFATMEFVPEHMNWDHPATLSEPTEIVQDKGMRVVVPGGFRARNEKIAEAATCLVRIASTTTKTYGSGWTADRAEALGKRVTRHTV